MLSKHRLVVSAPFATRSTISYGLIVYARKTKRWAIIQRKHSVEFLLVIRGLYRLTHLPLLLAAITSQEAQTLRRAIANTSAEFTALYLEELELDKSGLTYAQLRRQESGNTILKLLEHLETQISGNQLKWTWPKGRIQFQATRETPFVCAQREFLEEVEITLPAPLYVSDSCIGESFRTITGRIIESRYWVYVIPEEIPMTPPQDNPEVADRRWVSTETCQELLNYPKLFQQILTHLPDA